MARGGVNKVILVGNLGADPRVSYTPSGNAVANLSLATSESWRDKSGEMQERTEWHRAVIFGKLADIAGQYLRKGSKVYLEGKLQTRKWQDQQGQERYTTEIVVDINGQMQMLDGRQESGAAGDQSPSPQGQAYGQRSHSTGKAQGQEYSRQGGSNEGHGYGEFPAGQTGQPPYSPAANRGQAQSPAPQIAGGNQAPAAPRSPAPASNTPGGHFDNFDDIPF